MTISISVILNSKTDPLRESISLHILSRRDQLFLLVSSIIDKREKKV